MKRILALILALCLLAGLAACGAPSDVTEPAGPSDTETQQKDTESEQTQAPTDTEDPTEPVTEPPAGPYEITTCYANAYRNSLGEVWVQAMIAVKNTSEAPLCLDYSTMTVHVSEEETQELSYVLAFPSIIAPGEVGYYYEESPLDYEANGELDLTADLVITETTETPERYSVSGVTISDSPYGGLSISGTVIDDGAQEGKLIYIAVVLFDETDKPVAVCYTIHTETGASADRFELISFMLPERVTASSVARYEIYTYPYNLEAMR